MVLLYAVTDAHAPATEGAGLGDEPLRAVTHEDVRAVVSDTEHTPPADEARLWAYEQVVERLMADTAILPARFGTTAAGDEEITAMLAERQSELTGALARVREAVEYAVRPPVPAPAEHSRRPGTPRHGVHGATAHPESPPP